ncbi:hypothetical protein CF5_0039 [Staphylococcus phage CF5]|uniref:Uncharacterized protein n=1 Tax=Staphylococcus phage CF5 TaxID=3113739 RepID=A0AAX4J7M6_9CAUD|nr:hypothetical protein CF5_0039 [Staphylococcus phage CF5]
MSRKEQNFIYFCEYYFNEYLPNKDIEVLNHNATSHGTEDGIKRYYIANILYEGQELNIIIDTSIFNKAISMHDMLNILNKYVYNCIFIYLMDNYDKKEIKKFFDSLYKC